MSAATANGDAAVGKPNEEKTYKKVNKPYNLFIAYSLVHISNSYLL